MPARRRPPRPAAKPDQFTVCTKLCGARCCRYITVTVPAPRSEDDWDEVRWWLAHEGVMVTHDEDGWMLHVRTPCTNLRPDNACGVYPDHMLACQEYDPSDCEYTGEVPFDVLLEREADLADYLEKRRLSRGRRVAQAIRRAAERRSVPRPASPLVTLEGLAPRRDDAR
jgi:uncharacterized protein